MATERVVNILQCKAAAVSCLIVGISAILRPTKLKFGMNMPLHPIVSSVSGCHGDFVTMATRQVIDPSAV